MLTNDASIMRERMKRRTSPAGGGYKSLRKPFAKYSVGLAFLLPALCFYGIFQWYPILYNFVLAFQRYIPGLSAQWVGLRNFERVLNDWLLPLAFKNTLLYTGLTLLIGFVVPIIVAVALMELRRGRGFFRLAVYMPNIIPAIALYVLWLFLFNPAVGLLNQILVFLGLPALDWLLSSNTALVSLVIMSTWANFGSTAVLYMASLSAISEDFYEAAEIDGAGIWRRIRHITLPALKPTILLLLLLQILFTVQVLQEPLIMTGGGPNNATMTLMYMVYNYAFVYADFGRAGALGIMVFAFLMFLSILYVKFSNLVREEN